MGHLGPKTRSLLLKIEFSCLHSCGHNFAPIVMKFGQDVCPDDFSDEFKYGSSGSKNWVTVTKNRIFLLTL
jgi:hypothetical protein